MQRVHYTHHSTFPDKIVETPANFFSPSPFQDVLCVSKPERPTLGEEEVNNTCIRGTTYFILTLHSGS